MPSIPKDTSFSHIDVYGISIATDLDLIPTLPSRRGVTHLYVRSADELPNLSRRKPLYSSPTRETDAAPATRLHRVGDRFVFQFAGVAEFLVGPKRIEYVLHDDTYEYALELWLLGTVLAFWLEWKGVPALHASAAVVDGHAIGFLASKQGGKSTLATSLLQQGHSLLTDDLLPVDVQEERVQGRPGYPQMRMWPDHAEHFVEDAHALRRAHPYIEKRRVPVGPEGLGTFCDDARPLQALYIPERTDGASIQVQPVSPIDAMKAVLRHSFLPRIVEAAGWQAYRLSKLSRLAKQVPVRRLIYPEGVEHLPQVADTILNAET